MAQLKDTIVQGSLRATDSLLSTNGQFTKILAPSKNTNGTLTTSVGQGSDGYALMSNGTQVYWGNVATDTTGLLPKSGGTMTGTLTLKDIVGTNGTDKTYGTTLPTSSLTAGRIFFQISDPYHEIPSGGTTGQALIKSSNSNYDLTWGDAGGKISLIANNSLRIYPSGVGVSTGGAAPTTAQTVTSLLCNSNVYIENNVLYGACWNDYAEYRETQDKIEPGRCVIENGNGTLSLSTERMQPGAEIVSDTFGFAIGWTTKCKTPIAVSGRVLAYMYEGRDNIRIGAPVCSGPCGTVTQMTDEEAREFPWLIIGTVSSIPYETEWGEGKVKVNGRVWIRVR